MPTYNFKAQFADAVERGEKTQTIRLRRKRLTRVGDTLYLYTGMRTKACRKLREADCISIEPITVGHTIVIVGDKSLSYKEIHDLACKDGFKSVLGFLCFFDRQYGLPFDDAVLIKWNGEEACSR